MKHDKKYFLQPNKNEKDDKYDPGKDSGFARNKARTLLRQNHHDYYESEGLELFEKIQSSVTGYLSKGKGGKKFNSNVIINKIMNSKKYLEDINYKYYKKTREEILEFWKAETQRGTAIHKFIEYYLEDKPTYGILDLFFDNSELIKNYILSGLEKFRNYIGRDYSFFEAEKSISDPNLKMSGILDALFYNGKNYILVDWKSDSLFKSKKEKERKGGSKLKKYEKQLNIYRYILSEYYNISPSYLFIVSFGLDKPKQHIIDKKTFFEESLILDKFFIIEEVPIMDNPFAVDRKIYYKCTQCYKEAEWMENTTKRPFCNIECQEFFYL
jgi:hypothetical protein